MGTADVASAAAMGAAAGAVVASGGAAAAGAATKPAQSMADFMKNMGGGGSVSNASSRGLGGLDGGPLSTTASDFGPGGQTLPLNSFSGGSGGTSSSGSAPAAPQKEFDRALLSPQAQNAAGVSDAAKAAGAHPEIAKAASNTAYMGGSPQEIEAATLKAGGSQEQARAAAAASNTAGPSSGSNASIGSSSVTSELGQLAQSIGKLVDQNAPKKPGLGDRAAAFGKHIEQDKAATHVSINTHHSD